MVVCCMAKLLGSQNTSALFIQSNFYIAASTPYNRKLILIIEIISTRSLPNLKKWFPRYKFSFGFSSSTQNLCKNTSCALIYASNLEHKKHSVRYQIAKTFYWFLTCLLVRRSVLWLYSYQTFTICNKFWSGKNINIGKCEQ